MSFTLIIAFFGHIQLKKLTPRELQRPLMDSVLGSLNCLG
jgi:hypothetical protein